MAPLTLVLSILHFNDVYRVAPQKLSGVKGTIDVTQFAQLLDVLRARWLVRADGSQDGLVFFSGDLFAPSVESSVTRGSHMVPVLNYLAPDVSVAGNHDFDFGYPHLTKLLKDTASPWLLSNIVDTETMRVPDALHEFIVLDRSGVRIGVVGLVEEDWIATVSSWPSNFKWRDMAEVALELSARLRDPNGEYHCDLVVALTHARVPNDISLARALGALSPSAQQQQSIANTQGVDILLGGHDHFYFVSKGVNSWEGYDVDQETLGAEDDKADVLVVKSGTDFRELSEIMLELSDTPEGSVRKKIIGSIRGKRHAVVPEMEPSKPLKDILSAVLDSVSKSMKAVVCQTIVPLDLRSEFIRVEESASGNWFADVIRHAYDDALCMKGCGGSEAVFICAGSLRGDTVYGPGNITLGDIMEILPFEDSVVVLELDGKTIWAALEAGLSTWPAQEGRFPVVSGLRVTWDSRRPAGQRVLSVALQCQSEKLYPGYPGTTSEPASGTSTPMVVEEEEVKNEEGGRKYKVVTRQYMAGGYDGYLPLAGQKYFINDEEGQVMSTIVRKYLMGATYIKKMSHLAEQCKHLHAETEAMIARAKAHDRHKVERKPSSKARELWKSAIKQVRLHARSKLHYRSTLSVVNREHMTEVDCFDGQGVRVGATSTDGKDNSVEDASAIVELFAIHPVIDGRFKDVGRA